MIKSQCCNRALIHNDDDSCHCSGCDNLYVIEHVCQNCGDRNNWAQFEISTWYDGKCDICREKKAVTEYRDWFYGRLQKLT